MSKGNRKVYIVNKGGHDFSAAKDYGKLIFLTRGTINRFAVSHMYRVLNSELSKSDKYDYILAPGLTTLVAVACSIFANKHGRLNLLLYKDKKYIERCIVFD